MESNIQAVEDNLIHNLTFKSGDGASYVTKREQVSFFASGSDVYGAGGTRVIRITLNGDGWADLSSMRVNFTVNNTDASLALTPFVSGAHG